MNFKNVLATGLITATLFGAATTTHAQTALLTIYPMDITLKNPSTI
jgi:hypothetical protein